MQKENKNKNKEKGENKGLRVAACRYQSSKTLRKETRKGAVYQLARTCTKERP